MISPRRVGAFVDGQFGETFAGIPRSDAFNAGVTNQAENSNNVPLTTRDIEGVDVYRGVNNPAVNPTNPFGGTINYRPRQPSDKSGQRAAREQILWWPELNPTQAIRPTCSRW